MTAGPDLPVSLAGHAVHLVGIKGTGMTALAEVLSARGARLTGSDTVEKFYTDEILSKLGIPVSEGFEASHVPVDAGLVVHSAAYSQSDNPELIAAARRGIPMVTYPEALGILSKGMDSSAVSGVHGKSTTTALCGVILKAWDFPATVIVGTEVPAFDGRSALVRGDEYLVAETCEYRRHFLNFRARRIAITSVDSDHLDYFRDLEDILDAFGAFGGTLPVGGTLVYCADDSGACAAAARIRKTRKDLGFIPYGRNAEGDFRIERLSPGPGETRFSLKGLRRELSLRVPGEHMALNAACALALCREMWRSRSGAKEPDMDAAADALAAFSGCRRRSEVVGEAGGVLFLDDYAHHPTAVEKTLEGFAAFYPGRRLVVDFMPHTYSRTKALLSRFGACFGPAHEVILHGIYASAREARDGGVSGRDVYDEVSKNHRRVFYYERPEESIPHISSTLREGDVFITMGAGDNWKIGRRILRERGGSP
jgi:UDP-N-acetylmuramate--alanine ligase